MPERLYTTPLLDKLGVKPGARVAVLGFDEPWFRDLLTGRTDDVTVGHPKPDTDIVVFAADLPPQLDALPALRARIRPNGAIWVVSRKGRGATLHDVDVIEGALAAGLVDNKVASFSDTHTALRLVIRLKDRPSAPNRR